MNAYEHVQVYTLMPWWAEPWRHTVVGLCHCMCVCVCVCVCVRVCVSHLQF